MSAFIRSFCIITLVTAVSACGARAPMGPENDPYESFNRKMFAVEQSLDHYVV